MSIMILCGTDDPPNASIGNGSEDRPGLRKRLMEAMKVEIEELEFCNTVAQLIARFRRPQIAPAALILVVDRPDTLEALISVKDLFEGIPVIVVLTCEDPQTLRRSHALGPPLHRP